MRGNCAVYTAVQTSLKRTAVVYVKLIDFYKVHLFSPPLQNGHVLLPQSNSFGFWDENMSILRNILGGILFKFLSLSLKQPSTV